VRWDGWPIQISSAQRLGPPVTNDDQAARRPSMCAFSRQRIALTLSKLPTMQTRHRQLLPSTNFDRGIVAVVLNQGLKAASMGKNQRLQRLAKPPPIAVSGSDIGLRTPEFPSKYLCQPISLSALPHAIRTYERHHKATAAGRLFGGNLPASSGEGTSRRDTKVLRARWTAISATP